MSQVFSSPQLVLNVRTGLPGREGPVVEMVVANGAVVHVHPFPHQPGAKEWAGEFARGLWDVRADDLQLGRRLGPIDMPPAPLMFALMHANTSVPFAQRPRLHLHRAAA